jgi:chromatin segregation and condensation protein Rec8/ScpA/Scc1 (kleisin family)
MAATLIEIKSRKLLPTQDVSGESEGEEGLTEQSLQERLLLYDAFQKAATSLSQRSSLDKLTKTNCEWERLSEKYDDFEYPLRGETATLLILYEQMLGDLSERKETPVKTTLETITVDEIIEKLRLTLERLELVQLDSFYNKIMTRYELVVTVLGVLQMVRDSRLKLFQEEHMGPLWLYQNALNDIDVQKRLKKEH